MLYQNYLREFWCTAVVEDPNPPEDDSKVRHLKELIIKFFIKNGQKTLTLDFKPSVNLQGLIITKATKFLIPPLRSSTGTTHPLNKGNTQPIVKGSHSPLDEGTRKSNHLPEGKTTNPHDLEGNEQPVDMGLPATTPDEGISKTQPLP
ncbi:hypothetical protein Tco_0154423 [Tanacetum coccineum]